MSTEKFFESDDDYRIAKSRNSLEFADLSIAFGVASPMD